MKTTVIDVLAALALLTLAHGYSLLPLKPDSDVAAKDEEAVAIDYHRVRRGSDDIVFPGDPVIQGNPVMPGNPVSPGIQDRPLIIINGQAGHGGSTGGNTGGRRPGGGNFRGNGNRRPGNGNRRPGNFRGGNGPFRGPGNGRRPGFQNERDDIDGDNSQSGGGGGGGGGIGVCILCITLRNNGTIPAGKTDTMQ